MSTGQTKNESVNLDKLREVKVNFNELNDLKDEKKGRYLTAKYSAHQTSLVRKRLQVENWMYDYLKEKICDVSTRPFGESSKKGAHTQSETSHCLPKGLGKGVR